MNEKDDENEGNYHLGYMHLKHNTGLFNNTTRGKTKSLVQIPVYSITVTNMRSNSLVQT